MRTNGTKKYKLVQITAVWYPVVDLKPFKSILGRIVPYLLINALWLYESIDKLNHAIDTVRYVCLVTIIEKRKRMVEGGDGLKSK
jgi:hypothetical protein